MRIVRNEGGQDIIEYALLAAFVAIVVLGILLLFEGNLTALYNGIIQVLNEAAQKV